MRQFTVHRSFLTELFVIKQLPDFPKFYIHFQIILSDPRGTSFSLYIQCTLYMQEVIYSNKL
jgi:hypothetical protein